MTTPARRIFLGSFFVFLLASSATCSLEFSERSVSPSGQFIIYGGDAGFRGSVSALAERTKANLLSLLKQRDGWKIAVVLNLQTRPVNFPEMPATELRFSETEAGPKLQLDLIMSEKMRPTSIERELARVILVEMTNQTGIMAGDVFIEPPAWLVDGLLESTPARSHRSVVASLLPSTLPTISEFLNQRPETLDSTARQLYRVYSFALVQALIDSPAGVSRLNHYIGSLPLASNDPMADLLASFPEMPDLESAWKSKVVELSASLERDLLTFSRTDEKLNELLTSRLWNEQNQPVSIENISRPKPTSAQRTALLELSQKLLLLATRANPVLRPVVQDYQQIADQLVVGKIHGVAKRLAKLKSLRGRLSARMSDVDDYLNWFEAEKLETPSRNFEDSAGATAHQSDRPKRRDPLSIYLDAMELEF